MVSSPKLLLVGPPGAGKTVIANKISEAYKIPFIKVGSLLRDLPEDNKNYLVIKNAMEKGELAPNKIVAEIVKDAIEKTTGGFVLDGWLRQLSDLDEFDPKIDKVIFLDCPKNTCKERILNRVVCKIDNTIYSYSDTVCMLCGGQLEKRNDDTDETFENRWHVYEDKTMKVLEFFKNNNQLIVIDASKSIPEIMEEINLSL